MKFKIGDKVRVREDLDLSKSYGVLSTPNLVDKSLLGEIVTITLARFDVYHIKEDNGDCNWTDEMLEPIADPLAKKIEERNNKPEEEQAFTIKDNLGEQLKDLFEDDPIEPQHYRKGEIDLYESWYRTYPFNEFKAGMQMIAERYMRRDKNDRVEDLEKARYTLQRLKEYEEKERAKNEREISTYYGGYNLND